jgi:hypothetical protein
LYLSRCWPTAKFLGVRAKDLVDVVLTHEAAHFVSHVGIGGYQHTRWSNFSGASRADKEHVAQVACWGVFAVFERPDLVKVMRTLANHQEKIYNSWRKFEEDRPASIGNPLQIVAEVTLEVAKTSGRKAQSVIPIENMHEQYDYNNVDRKFESRVPYSLGHQSEICFHSSSKVT